MVESLANIPIEDRWRNQKQPAPFVISIIRRNHPLTASDDERSSYLLIRRKSGPYRHYWALVGGKWDFGESLSAAALREIEEETGLIGTFDSLLGLVNERARIDYAKSPGAAHFLLFVCQVDTGEGEAQEQDEGEIAWFTLDEIEQLNDTGEIIPSDFAMISHFVDKDALPYVEVEMESVSDGGPDPEEAQLTRFEVIN